MSVDLADLTGPLVLGRSVLVTPDQLTPEPWQNCERLTVDAGRPSPEAKRALRQAWCERRRIVIELSGEVPDPQQVLRKPWWELHPGTTLGPEVLHHLLTANVVDARDPQSPRFAPRDRALALGATEVSPGGYGDVIVHAAGPSWCDGGPLNFFEADDSRGASLICAANLAAGSLAPLRPCVLTADLAPDQNAAAAQLGGGVRVLAPAGSGKTRVLTERARYLLRDLGLAPTAVCLVAYNVRARAEIQQRTQDLKGFQVRTLNSLALAICNGTGGFARPSGHPRVSVIVEREARDILDAVLTELNLLKRRRALTDPLAPWIEALTASRLGLRDPAEVEKEYSPDIPGFAHAAQAYAKRLDRDHVVDFDHQIIRAIEVLLTDPEARITARQLCGVLLVDEFQDLTPAHLLLIRLIGGPRADVFGVGDDDQTIYGYNGASPQFLIDFPRFFPCAATRELHVNYRCPPEVVAAASNLLSHNRLRYPKRIVAAPDKPDSANPRPTICISGGGFAELTARVAELQADGVNPTDVAVLSRVNSVLLVPQIALAEADIPSTKPVGQGFLQRTGAAASLAWLKLAVVEGSLPGDALARAVKCPPRSLSPRLQSWVCEQRNVAALQRLSQRLNEQRDSQRVAEFADDIEGLRRLARPSGGRLQATTGQLLAAIDRIGVRASLEERLDGSRRAVDRSAHGDDVAVLLAIASLHDDPNDFETWLASHLPINVDGPDQSGDRGVHLATVHKVKGRQWPHVVVYGASHALMPHRLAGDIEEELRIFHVAITRASRSLLILHDGRPSEFIAAMDTPIDRTDPTGRPDQPERLDVPRLSGRRDSIRRQDPGSGGPAATEEASLTGEEQAWFECLRAWRPKHSRAAKVPAFVVFYDKTLEELARRRPVTDEGLLAISGIGQAKLKQYGDELKRLFSQPAVR